MSTNISRNIETGDPRPRIFVQIEAAVHPSDTASAAVDELHNWLVGRVEDWFTEDVALNITTSVEPTDEDWS